MVEKSHTSGFWPSIYDPLRQMSERMAEWLAPASEAAADDDSYRISIELPGVEEKDIHLSVENGMVMLKGEKKSVAEVLSFDWSHS